MRGLSTAWLLGLLLGASPVLAGTSTESLGERLGRRLTASLERLARYPEELPPRWDPPRFRRGSTSSPRGPFRSGEAVELRVPSNAHVPHRLLMLLTPETVDEVSRVARALAVMEQEGRFSAPSLHLLTSGDVIPAELGLPVEAEAFLELDTEFPTDDPWLQDWGEVVLVSGRPLLLEFGRGRGLTGFGEHLAGGLDLPLLPVPGAIAEGDYGGNVEATPDGFLLLGNTVSHELEKFFQEAGYGERVLVVDTDWLDVGHVDEFLCPLPIPGRSDPGAYRLVVPDPDLALARLGKLGPARWEEEMEGFLEAALGGEEASAQQLEEAPEPTGEILDQLDGLRSALRGEWSPERSPEEREKFLGWVRYNRELGERIRTILADLGGFLAEGRRDHLPPDLIRIPSLWVPGDEGRARSLLPEATNMVVLPHRVLVPDPLLPCFREQVGNRLSEAGYTVHPIPGLTYHIGQGQLHCASYAIRGSARWPGRGVFPRIRLVRRAPRRSTGP